VELQPPVITRLLGGLGNQLFQYAAGRSVANFLGRPLLIDIRTILAEAPVRHYDLGAFRIREGFVTGLEAFYTRWLGSVRVGGVFRSLFPGANSYKYLRDREEGFDERVFAPHDGPIVLHGYWQSYRYSERSVDELRRELAFRNEPDRDNAVLLQDVQSCESVCVHVRRGDYVNNPSFSENLGTCDMDYYKHAFEIIAARVSRPKFFLFSDEPAWASSNLRFPGPAVTVDHNNGKSDAEDLRLMSRCRHFIIANSSFSWWGAWLSEGRNKIVVAPTRWFKQDRVPATDRTPPGWIRA
jgi:Glycosyl transferase family 11